MNPKPTTTSYPHLRRRQAVRAEAEISMARAEGDHAAAERLILRQVNYPEWCRQQARDSAARLACLPLSERFSSPAQASQQARDRPQDGDDF